MPRPLRSEVARAIANLAIEVGDPGRMAKARRIHRKGAVAALEIEPSAAYATVLDGDVSFEVSLKLDDLTEPGSIPRSDDLITDCDCDLPQEPASCQHALAALLGLAESFETNGRLLDLWTDSTSTAPAQAPLQSAGAERFFDRPASGVPVGQLNARAPVKFPSLQLDDVAAGPVFEDAVETIRRTLTRYRVQR